MAAIFTHDVGSTIEFLVKNEYRQGWPFLKSCQQASTRIYILFAILGGGHIG